MSSPPVSQFLSPPPLTQVSSTTSMSSSSASYSRSSFLSLSSPYFSSPSLLLFIFKLLLLSLFVLPASAFTIHSATLRTEVVGLGGVPSSSTSQTIPLLATTKVGILNVIVNADLYVNRNETEEHSWLHVHDAHTPDQLYGLMRLICGIHVFDTHPLHQQEPLSENAGMPLPTFLLPTPQIPGQWMEEVPILATMDEWSDSNELSSAPEGRTLLKAVFVLSSVENGAIVHHVDSSDLSSCTVRVLDPHSQSYLPIAHVKDRLGKSLKRMIEHPVQLVEDQFLLSGTSASSQSIPLVEDSTVALLRRLRSLQVEAGHSFVEASVSAQVESQVQFAGMLKGLISGIMKPMMKSIGTVVGDFTAAGIIEPVAQQLESGLSESVASGVAPFIGSDIVVQILPGLQQSVVGAVVENLAQTIGKTVMQTVTEPITSSVNDLVSNTIINPVTHLVAGVTSVDLSRRLIHTLSHILGKSIPHIIVPSLVNTLSIGAKEDYYCYFCKAKSRYCEYCASVRSGVMNRNYYALYYTGYHTNYYAHYYANQATLTGAMTVQRKTVVPLDEVDDSIEKEWQMGRSDGYPEPQPPPILANEG